MIGLKIQGCQNGDIDRSYKWVEKIPDITELQKGIPIQTYIDKLKNINTHDEYRLIQKLTESKAHQDSVVKLEKKYKLNRYKDITPYNETRVMLTRNRIKDPQNSFINSYINANYVHTSLADDTRFIATQAPLDQTIQDFWEMVIDTNVTLIYMLCQLEQYGKQKCGKYYPQSLEQPQLVINQNMTVLLEKVTTIFKNIILRTFSVIDNSHPSNPIFRMVTQFQFGSWMDHNAPQLNQIQDIKYMVDYAVQKIEKDIQHQMHERVLVHCSAGVGRTGTLIAIANIQLALNRMLQHQQALKRGEIEYFEDKYEEQRFNEYMRPRIPVFAIVRRLREQRYLMVQTEVQYNFIHQYFRLWVLKKFKVRSDSIDLTASTAVTQMG